VLLLSPLAASAVTVELPDGYVGHTRMLPVIIHRIFPPFLGKHVYLRTIRDQPADVIYSQESW
jgi:hypothetical protein